MAELPTGTVTFLFSDLEGSTRHWEERPEATRDALARHGAILEYAIAGHAGVVFSRMGDGMAAAFSSARDAFGAAVATQQNLANSAWPEETGPLRARMDIHTGERTLLDSPVAGGRRRDACRLVPPRQASPRSSASLDVPLPLSRTWPT
jgi:class 3 adenylate cyclase